MDKPKRYIIAIGSPESPGCAYLKKVPTDVERIVKFFESASQGYEHVLSEEIPIGAPSAVVKKALEEWFASDTLKRSDTVVIYFAGHGEPDVGKFNSACLLLSDSKIKLPSTYITSRDLISIIYGGENERPGSILLILDVCYAGAFAGQGIGEAVNAISEIEADSGFCTMGSTAKSVAEDGVFLEAFFGTYSDDAWRPAGRNFPILDLVEGMNRWFEINRKGQRASCNITGARGRNKFIFTELKRQVGIQDFAHWDIKARGIDYAGLKDWFFSGRIIALKEICNWLKTETPTKIVFVTGDPGSGKSALLGRTLLSAIPSTRDSIMEGLKIKIDDDTLPEADSIKAYVNLKGSEVRDVIKILASQFDVQADSAEELVNSLAGLTNKISGIIFDSLDEANDSFIHFAELFELLASISNVKLIIGSRRNILLNHFGTRARTIDLDDTKYFDYRDIQNFIYNRFKTAPAFAKMNAETEVNLKRLTERITIKANHSFLYGRVVSRYLIDKLSPEAIEHGEPFEDLRVPEDINEAFGEDLRRFKNGQQNLVEDLLVPLAYARGKGMPQKNIWCSVASKIANRTYSNTDIRKLKEEASYYLIEDVDNGEVVCRIFQEPYKT
ncbi:MAG: caspase family protein [Bacteroidota bacterium]